jgi:predicted cupin superfamily sugar epimerase
VTAPRTADEWVRALDLAPHPEGGYYRETYRAEATSTPPGFPGPRVWSTAIYFLLRRGEISALHRLRSDELWHFHAGATLGVVELTTAGGLIEHRLGLDVAAGERPQLVIAAGSWFGARVVGNEPFTLAGCTVAPGFDFADFELGEQAALAAQFPAHAAVIATLTRQRPRGESQ